MRPRLQIAFGCDETGYGSRARPPRSLSLHQGSLILSAQSWNINNNNLRIVFRVKVLWEETVTSGSYKQTVAAVHKLQTKIGQSNDGDSNPKVTDFIKEVHPRVLWRTAKGLDGD